MLVEITHKNKNMEIVDIERLDFDIYCKKLSQDLISILSDIENFIEKQKIVNEDYYVDELYHVLRHRLFDVAGAVSRLNDSIVRE